MTGFRQAFSLSKSAVLEAMPPGTVKLYSTYDSPLFSKIWKLIGTTKVMNTTSRKLLHLRIFSFRQCPRRTQPTP